MNTLQHMDTTYKPSGGLAGIYAGEQAADQRFANDMALGQQALALEKSANQNPLELIVKQKEAALAQQDMSPEMMAARKGGFIGQNQSLEAKGFVDMFTKDATAKAKLAEAMSKGTQEQQQATVTGLEMFIAKATSGGPSGLSMAMQDLDPQAQQLVQGLVKQGQDPVKFAKQLRELLVSQMSDNPKQRGAMDLQRLKDRGDMSRTAVQTASNERIASANREATTNKANNDLLKIQAKRAADEFKEEMKDIRVGKEAITKDIMLMKSENKGVRESSLAAIESKRATIIDNHRKAIAELAGKGIDTSDLEKELKKEISPETTRRLPAGVTIIK